MTVVSVPIERSPEVWLEKVAAPLIPEVREAATKPLRRRLAKKRSKGMTDTEILVQWGTPNHEREKLSKGWPTLAELQYIAEYVWCFPLSRPSLKGGLVKQSLTGALFFTALITLLIFFVQETFSANVMARVVHYFCGCIHCNPRRLFPVPSSLMASSETLLDGVAGNTYRLGPKARAKRWPLMYHASA